MKSDRPRAVRLGDLGQLTLRGNVAFAVRCALRVRPWFKLPADAPSRREHMEAMDGAIGVATAFCQRAPEEAGQAAAAAQRAAVMAEKTCEVTRFAGYAAVRAAEAAAHAEEFGRNQDDSSIMEVVAAAFGAGRVLAANADNAILDLIVAALVADAEKLRSLGHGTCRDLGLPVDPSDNGPLGPLWPDGAPPGFVGE